MLQIENLLNKIINADCMEILKELPDNSIDLVLTDPPYEFKDGKISAGGGIYKNDNKKHLEKIKSSFGTTFNPSEFLELIENKMKKVNMLVWTNKHLLTNYIEFAAKKRYNFEIFLWTKPNPIPAYNNHLLIDKEYCVIIRENGAYFNNDLQYEDYFTYYDYPIGKKESEHPTEKPIKIFEHLIKVFSKKYDIVLDCFSGSGTTAIACHNLEREFICIEKDKDFYNESIQRLENAKAQLKIF